MHFQINSNSFTENTEFIYSESQCKMFAQTGACQSNMQNWMMARCPNQCTIKCPDDINLEKSIQELENSFEFFKKEAPAKGQCAPPPKN